MYPSGYTQDTSQYIRIRILITNPPTLDNKPPLTRMAGHRPPARPRRDVLAFASRLLKLEGKPETIKLEGQPNLEIWLEVERVCL